MAFSENPILVLLTIGKSDFAVVAGPGDDGDSGGNGACGRR